MSWMYFDQKQLNKNADASADCTNKKNKKTIQKSFAMTLMHDYNTKVWVHLNMYILICWCLLHVKYFIAK